jgi:hypothetical protein
VATSRALVRQAFYDRIESDDKFFQYFGDLSDEEIQEIADERANTYINRAIVMLKRKCEPQISFAIDAQSDSFVDDLTDEEIILLGGDLAFEAYLDTKIAKLDTMVNTFSSSDLKALHSPANERKSFMDMCKDVKAENQVKISDYASRDRLTGKFFSVNEDGVYS